MICCSVVYIVTSAFVRSTKVLYHKGPIGMISTYLITLYGGSVVEEKSLAERTNSPILLLSICFLNIKDYNHKDQDSY